MKFSWIDILMIVLFILSVYFILTRIFGHSASDLTITVTLFGALGTLIYKLNREVGEFKIKTMYGFDAVKQSFEKVKEDMGLIKSDLGLIKNKFKIK